MATSHLYLSQAAFDVSSVIRQPPGRIERALVGLLIWAFVGAAYVAALLTIGAAAMASGASPKATEFALGITFFPLFLMARGIRRKAHKHLLPTQLDLFLAQHGYRADRREYCATTICRHRQSRDLDGGAPDVDGQAR